MARTAELRSVTEILVHRDRLDVGFPMAIFASFIGHVALLIFLSVFQGFHWGHTRTELNLGGGAPEKVTMVSLPTIGQTQTVPAIQLPPPPAPATVDVAEPAIDIPSRDAEVEFKLPDPPKPKTAPKLPTPTATVAAATPAPKLGANPSTVPAKPTKGALGLLTGSGDGSMGIGGGQGPATDPGLAFYAQRITSLIGEAWRKPYVNVGGGTVLASIVYFGIRKDGTVFGIDVEETSGIPNMDQSAMRAVIDAGRLPPLPPTFTGDELTVSFKFQYTAGE